MVPTLESLCAHLFVFSLTDPLPYLIILQIFIEALVCARHCTRHWAMVLNGTDTVQPLCGLYFSWGGKENFLKSCLMLILKNYKGKTEDSMRIYQGK